MQKAKSPLDVKKLTETSFSVQSSNGSTEYKVESGLGVYVCSCPHFTFRGLECKHIKAVKQEYGEPEQCEEAVRSQTLLEMM